MSAGQLGRRTLALTALCALMQLPGTTHSEESGTKKHKQPDDFDPDAPVKFNLPRLPLMEALERFADALDVASFEGLNESDEQRAPNIIVGPVRGRMPPKRALNKLAKNVCADHYYEERDNKFVLTEGRFAGFPVIYQPRVNRPPVPQHVLDIERVPRLEALGRIEDTFGYHIIFGGWDVFRDENGQLHYEAPTWLLDPVGPIKGEHGIFTPLTQILKGTGMTARWVGGGPKPSLLIEPYRKRFLVGDCQETFLVTGENEISSVFGEGRTLDRQRIDDLNVATVPDALRYASSTAFTRPSGYRLSGAQYAEMRGLGAAYTKVLINGRPVDASAPDIGETAAYDLNSIPMEAVEKIEISPDVPSLTHGADAIGGTVNIVLRKYIETPYAAVRFGTPRGGGSEWTGTLAAGNNGERLKSAVVLDVSQTDQLLGVERDLWRNQDFTRFGGQNYASQFAAPANLRSMDGRALPGLSSSIATVAVGPTGDLLIQDGAQNRTSLLAMQAIQPAAERVTLSSQAEITVNRRATVRAEALLARHSSTFRLIPALVTGLTLGAGHPQNPFGVDVVVDAALSGLPPRQHRGTAEQRRGVLEIEGTLAGSWTYSMFGLYSDERAKSWRENNINPAALMESLSGRNELPVNILSPSPGQGSLSLLAPPQVDRLLVGSSQVTARVRGDLVELSTGEVTAEIGAQARSEFVRFDAQVGRVERDIYSGFSLLTIPTLDRTDLSIGARRDHYSDVGPITSMQYGITWRPARLNVHAVYSEAFNAPSHYDLYFPRREIPFQIFDPQRQEVSLVTFIAGGNVNLHPTTSRSLSLGVSWADPADRLRAAVDLWDIEMRDRVGVVLPFALLANERQLTINRIQRDRPSADDEQAGLPGRLRSIDITRGNFGTTQTRGIDVSVQKRFDFSAITVEPRLDVTYTSEFRDSAIPIRGRPLRDRVGVASEFGSITPWRAVACVKSEAALWGINLCGRYHPSYSDYIPTLGLITGRKIPSNTLWDLNLSWSFSEKLSLSAGAFNILDEGAQFAQVGDTYGFDTSQSDIEGRTLFLKTTGSF